MMFPYDSPNGRGNTLKYVTIFVPPKISPFRHYLDNPNAFPSKQQLGLGGLIVDNGLSDIARARQRRPGYRLRSHLGRQ